MKIIKQTFFFSKIFLAEDIKHVVDLTEATFKDYIANKSVLVKFYAPWCGHCKALEPIYEEAAETLASDEEMANSNVKFARVDVTAHTSLGQVYQIDGYPTLKLFSNDNIYDYDGPRTKEALLGYVKKMHGPAISKFDDSKNHTILTMIIESNEVSDEEESFAKKYINDLVVLHKNTNSTKKRISIRHPYEDEVVMTEKSDSTNLLKFFHASRFPLWGALDGNTFRIYEESQKPVVWILFSQKKAEDLPELVEKHRKEVHEMAKKMKDVTFTYTCTTQFGQALEHLLALKTFPAIAFQPSLASKKKFHYNGTIFSEDGSLETEKILEYLKAAQKGELKAVFKSESPPETQEEPVVYVVGNTLKEIVFDKNKDVLFEIYAPWCGHCKKLEPHFNALAKKIKEFGLDDEITIAKMDGTENDSPVDSINWTGFPTLVYIKKGTEEVIPVKAERTTEGLLKWIQENHSQKEKIQKKIEIKDETDKEEL